MNRQNETSWESKVLPLYLNRSFPSCLRYSTFPATVTHHTLIARSLYLAASLSCFRIPCDPWNVVRYISSLFWIIIIAHIFIRRISFHPPSYLVQRSHLSLSILHSAVVHGWDFDTVAQTLVMCLGLQSAEIFSGPIERVRRSKWYNWIRVIENDS